MMTLEKSCGAIVFRKFHGNVEILLINHANGGHWSFPKGHVEDGETEVETATREIFEETGLTVTDYRYRGIVTFVSDIYETEYMHLFTVTDWYGEARECDEGELAWIKKQKLFDLTLWQGDRIFLQLLQEDVPFFSLKLTYQGDELLEAVLNGEKI